MESENNIILLLVSSLQGTKDLLTKEIGEKNEQIKSLLNNLQNPVEKHCSLFECILLWMRV